jgi:hypothetical protein
MILRLSVLLWSFLVAPFALAEPVQLHVAGEIVVDLPGADTRRLAGAAHDRITHITFHHEGFAGNDAALFARASRARAGQSLAQRVRNIHRYHARDAGLGMFAYHYAVGPGGGIARGRPVRYRPATRSTVWGGTARADFAGHFAVVVLGDFNHERLTPAARQALLKVMSQAQRTYRVPTAHILPHRAHANTACPGRFLLEEAAALAEATRVVSLQTELRARGCLEASPDGLWGPVTARAHDRLAKRHGLQAAPRGGPDDSLLFTLLDRPGARCD